MILFRLRQGIGLDIEYTEDICHVGETEDRKDIVLAFNGIVIKLPLFQIYIGDIGIIGKFVSD